MDPVLGAAIVAAVASVSVALIQLRGQREQKKIHNKIKETHHQVTTNSHSSPIPTIPDRLDDLGAAISEIKSWQEIHDAQHRIERHHIYGYQGD